jgi:hypothetical protein
MRSPTYAVVQTPSASPILLLGPRDRTLPREGTPMVPDAPYPPRPAFRTIVVLGGIRTPSARRREDQAYKGIAVPKPNRESRRADSNR